MNIKKQVIIDKPIVEVWDVVGKQFGEIDKWASVIYKSKVSGESKLKDVAFSIRSTDTTQGSTKQEIIEFSNDNYSLKYKAISGTPFFIKDMNASWVLSEESNNSTKVVMNMEVELKGLIGVILTPVAKLKLGKLGSELMGDLKYYLEKGKPHPRKVQSQ